MVVNHTNTRAPFYAIRGPNNSHQRVAAQWSLETWTGDTHETRSSIAAGAKFSSSARPHPTWIRERIPPLPLKDAAGSLCGLPPAAPVEIGLVIYLWISAQAVNCLEKWMMMMMVSASLNVIYSKHTQPKCAVVVVWPGSFDYYISWFCALLHSNRDLAFQIVNTAGGYSIEWWIYLRQMGNVWWTRWSSLGATVSLFAKRRQLCRWWNSSRVVCKAKKLCCANSSLRLWIPKSKSEFLRGVCQVESIWTWLTFKWAAREE